MAIEAAGFDDVGREAFKRAVHGDKKTGRRRSEYSPTVSHRLIAPCRARSDAITVSSVSIGMVEW